MAGSVSSTGVGYCYDPRMKEHKHLCYDHPEQPTRISRIFDTLELYGCTSRMIALPVREVSEDEVTMVHSRNVWERVNEIESMTVAQIRSKYKTYAAKSLFVNPSTPSSVRLSCGATIEAAMAVAEGRCTRSVAIVRPPGHHAEPNKSMGFCFFNNVAVAAKVIMQKTAMRKILIMDWDVHHGNGIQAAFEEDPNVLYISIHRYENASFYPNDTSGSHSSKGKGRGLGFSVNIPWSKGGKHDGDYIYAFEQVVMPISREFDPDIVLVSAGFDAAEGDPLGECNVTPYGFSQMANQLCSLADGRVVVVLEGGYDLKSTSCSMLAVTKVLLGDSVRPTSKIAEPDRATLKTISDVRRAYASYWTSIDFDVTLIARTSTSHHTSNITTQKKRKRKDSDGEYTPHQKVGNNSSTSSKARRTSKRLAAVAQLEPPPCRNAFATKRSSSSTTSASSSSLDHLQTPKYPDASDIPAPSSKPERPPPGLFQYDWSDLASDSDLSDTDSLLVGPPVKIGFPSKEKKLATGRNHSSTTKPPMPVVKTEVHHHRETAGTSHTPAFVPKQERNKSPSTIPYPPSQSIPTPSTHLSPPYHPVKVPGTNENGRRLSTEEEIGFLTVLHGLLKAAAP